MRKLFVLLMVVMLILNACSNATIENANKELIDTISNMTDVDNKYVLMVKYGYQEINPNITYEKAFTAFFGTPRWRYFESQDGQNIVEFTGDCTYQDVPVKARIQFIVYEEEGTFEAAYLAFNEVPQNTLYMVSLIEKAFEEVENTTSYVVNGDDNSISNSGEICFKGEPILRLLGSKPEELYNIFGNPTSGTPVDGYLYEGGEYYGYDDVFFIIDYQTGCIGWITGEPNVIELDGVTLDKTRTELIGMLGEPSNEAFDDYIGDYNIKFTLWNDSRRIVLSISMPDPNEKAYFATIGYYYDVLSDEEYLDSANGYDSNSSNDQQNSSTLSSIDLLGSWNWQGKDMVNIALGGSTERQLTLYSNGTCGGQIAMWNNLELGFVTVWAPDMWSFLEYEQILQVSGISTEFKLVGDKLDSVPIYDTISYNVTISDDKMYLENVNDSNTKLIEYTKVK